TSFGSIMDDRPKPARGVNGTAPSAHASGATVTQISYVTRTVLSIDRTNNRITFADLSNAPPDINHNGRAVWGLNPSDLELRGNYIYKPVAWRTQSWSVKNILELKNAQRVVIDGNVLEHHWPAAQAGFSVLFTPR